MERCAADRHRRACLPRRLRLDRWPAGRCGAPVGEELATLTLTLTLTLIRPCTRSLPRHWPRRVMVCMPTRASSHSQHADPSSTGEVRHGDWGFVDEALPLDVTVTPPEQLMRLLSGSARVTWLA